MNAERLRAAQAPKKALYKENPTAGVRTLRSWGRVNQDAVTFTLESGKPGVPAGLHEAAGGDGSAACSGDMLLEALVSCAGVTLAAVSTSMGIELKDARVSAEGDMDFRGTLGVARDVPVGFTALRLKFSILSDAPAEKLQKLVELSERYCVVLQTLAQSHKVEVALE